MSVPPTGHDPHVARVLETLQRGLADDSEVAGLVEGAAQPMMILDESARILAVNPRAEAFLGRERRLLADRAFALLVHAPDRASVRKRLDLALRTRQGPDDLTTRLRVGDGSIVEARLTFLPFRTKRHTRLALLVRDTLRERALDRRVAELSRELASSRAERAESVETIARQTKLIDLGKIASGVAHELRSPVAYIENLARLSEVQAAAFAKRHPELRDEIEPLRENAATIHEGAVRIHRLLEELRPLMRSPVGERAAVDLAVVVADAVRAFRGSETATTAIVLDLQATHPVRVNVPEMSRVILNLLKNASEAMGGAGRITISTRNRDAPPQIRIADEGPGVPPDAKLFEPFYTTKREGTGLGLAISKRIVESHGGKLRHERPPGGGAAFVIEFPLEDRASDA